MTETAEVTITEGTETEAAEKPKREKIVRKPYDGECARDDAGLLTALPEDFDTKLHEPLKKEDFNHPALHLEWRANLAEVRGNAAIQAAANLRAQAESVRKYGDPKKQKKAEALAKMRDKMVKMAAELEIDLDDLFDEGDDD